MRLAAGLCPDPLGELERSPRPLSRKKGGLLLRGGEGRGKGSGEERKGEGKRRRGEGRRSLLSRPTFQLVPAPLLRVGVNVARGYTITVAIPYYTAIL